MARGWESKAVESQIESAEAEHSGSRKALMTPEQIKRERELESLELSRTRVVRDMESSNNPKYRELLQRSLDYLNEKIAALDGSNNSDHPE